VDVKSNVAFRFLRMDVYWGGGRPFSSCGGVEIDHYTILCHLTLVQKEKTWVGEHDMYVSLGDCAPGCWQRILLRSLWLRRHQVKFYRARYWHVEWLLLVDATRRRRKRWMTKTMYASSIENGAIVVSGEL